MRLLDTRPTESDEWANGLFTDARDAQRYQRILESELWRIFKTALEAEREALFSEDTTTDASLRENRGAIKWLSRWLQSGPYLMVQYLRQQETNP
jgi:hypothetical protein